MNDAGGVERVDVSSVKGCVERVDVFSVKGGVGKTTMSVLLARAQAEHSKKPVLLIDADLTGTCLGHLLAPNIRGDWNEVLNLAHLICDPPETLDEMLGKDTLPVYSLPSQHDADPREHRVASVERFENQVLYCPSHGSSTGPRVVDQKVLQALAGHETAGGWVRLVIQKVIQATREVAGELGGVIVDHSPGMAALQAATLEDIAAARTKRRALFVTTCDRVDLKMTNAMVAHLQADVTESSVFVINRVRGDWREQTHVKEEFGTGWVKRASPQSFSADLQKAYEQSARFASGDQGQLEDLRRAVFGG
jgi:CobQ/CobB/MinD/ParA nucleotide binding domain